MLMISWRQYTYRSASFYEYKNFNYISNSWSVYDSCLRGKSHVEMVFSVSISRNVGKWEDFHRANNVNLDHIQKWPK